MKPTYEEVERSPCEAGGAHDWANEDMGPEPEDGFKTLCLKCFKDWGVVERELAGSAA